MPEYKDSQHSLHLINKTETFAERPRQKAKEAENSLFQCTFEIVKTSNGFLGEEKSQQHLKGFRFGNKFIQSIH